MTCAAMYKPDPEPLDAFIKRKGGIKGREARDLPGQDQSSAQIRMQLSLVRVASMHHHIDPVEPAFDEAPIGRELE
jgi:hypothetical protein